MQACFWPQAGGSLSGTRELSRVNWEEFICCQVRLGRVCSLSSGQRNRRPSVSFVSETGMSLSMPCPIISGGPLLSQLCSALARHCIRLLVVVVDWCASLLVRLIFCLITWHQSPSRITCAFRSREVRRLLLYLDPHGDTDPCFLFFLRELLRLVRLLSFPACWRQANVTPIPKGPPSSLVANDRPISITSVWSNLFERLVSVRLGRLKFYGAQWCASNRPVCILEWSGYLWCTFFVFPMHFKVHRRVSGG